MNLTSLISSLGFFVNLLQTEFLGYMTQIFYKLDTLPSLLHLTSNDKMETKH